MITIIDLGLGNVNSVSRALTYLRIENVISSDAKKIEKAEKLIFPGVGNFFEASKRMYSTGIAGVIQKQVSGNKKPLLGICLGMQLLAKTGEEGGSSDGLGLIDANVSKLKCEKDRYHLPHVGWNDISEHDMKWFSGVEDHSCFYFVHSYEMVLNDSNVE
ncbi:MAG: imidazole glycerol phosphate synthase subunit HisH, partial [Candidatus Auribacterota bacterium]|nr:imidazole glycerol phosphate synthase subunit HisH [Candidatus Auribacterota bacterium]